MFNVLESSLQMAVGICVGVAVVLLRLSRFSIDMRNQEIMESVCKKKKRIMLHARRSMTRQAEEKRW